MDNKEKIIEKCIGNIEDRVLGVQNDLKAFLYIRKNNLQHKKDDIGGGNMVVALSLFTCLNFLGKIYDCAERPSEFYANNGRAKNETVTFIHFMRFIQKRGIDLNLPADGDVLTLVWSGFRDHLAHRLTVEPGKSVITFTYNPNEDGSINDMLVKAKKDKVFEHDGNSRNWRVNGDSLHAYLPDIVNTTTEFLRNREDVDTDLLLKVIGVEYP